MARGKAESFDWDKFWLQAWLNLIHAIGMISVVIVAGLILYFVWWLFFSSSSSSIIGVIVPKIETNSALEERKTRKKLFNALVKQTPQPCAVKEKGAKVSNVEKCTLFQLRPGMGVSTVRDIIDSSGYFSNKATFHQPLCRPNDCLPNFIQVTTDDDDFTVRADFGDGVIAHNISLSFKDKGTHPYFDPKSMRTTFVKLIGSPDDSTGSDDDYWGERDREKGKWGIWAYSYRESYWVIFYDGIIEKKKIDEDKPSTTPPSSPAAAPASAPATPPK